MPDVRLCACLLPCHLNRFFHPPLAGQGPRFAGSCGKVRGQTPKVAKKEKSKKQTGRAKKRLQYNRRFVNVQVGVGKKKGPNTQPLGKMG